jgi:hypothetical protein
MSIPNWITNDFLRLHLSYVENTESPTLMHTWSAISAASACMGRHVWLPTGIGPIYGNVYVLLVGPPGTRKSSAINAARKLLNGNTNVRFSPDDTGGQRQGLITAIEGDEEDLDELGIEDLNLFTTADAIDKITDISNLKISCLPEDKYTMFVCASEFGSFMGENSKEMVRFLIKMWDGENYTYKLKTSKQTLKDPLLTMIGGTTTTDISEILPPAAIGQGFMSRIILVFVAQTEKKIARPTLHTGCIKKLKAVYNYLSCEMNGPLTESPEAAKLLDRLYMAETKITDSRFIYYSARRQTHLIKLAMILAATCKRYVIEAADVEQADIILSYTEENMPDALGEYGLSPLANAKQKMMEFIQHAKTPVASDVLWMIMQRDMKLIDFRNSIADLINAKKIMQVETSEGKAFVYNSLQQEALELLTKIEQDQSNQSDQSDIPGELQA